MVAVYIYIDELISSVLTPVAHRITLFKDETISVTSSVQNINDIGKTYTDYSQSFTIPANAKNNKIFKYWYENALEDGFDHRIKYYGYIEVDGMLFRDGKFQLEKANKKDGAIESYTITFVGNLTQLKDRFKSDKLNALSFVDGDGITISCYDELNHDWTLAEVQDRVISTAYDIQYPLIGNNRKFYYNEGTASQDITDSSGAVKYDELFPAIRVTKIFEYIQTCYGITFDSVFFESDLFSRLYLYLKNKETFQIQAQEQLIDFTSKDTDVHILDVLLNNLDDQAVTFTNLNLTTNSLLLSTNLRPRLVPPWKTTQGPFFTPYSINRITRRVILKVITSSTDLYTVRVYNNNVLFTSFNNVVGTRELTVFNQAYTYSVPQIDYNFTFSISSINPITYETEVYEDMIIQNTVIPAFSTQGSASIFDGEGYQIQRYIGYSASQTTVANINIKDFVPDITVESFLTGIIKTFNLAIYPIGETSFRILPLELYYQDGSIIDITKHIDSQEVEIQKPKIYKRLDFKHEKSDNVLNNAFRGLFNLEYGDLFFENKNSTSTESYEIKTPFEDVMYERTTGYNFQTATLLDKDFNPYIPKPILMFQNGLESVSPNIKIGSTSTTNSISSYVRFSNELQSVGGNPNETETLNFGAETSSWDLVVALNGLYQKYYSNYIQNLFNIKTRVVKVKAILSTHLLNTLKLNDRLIVRNKRYIINNMTINLETKETQFELITDLRTLDANPTVLRYSNTQSLFLNNDSHEVQIQIYLKDQDLWRGKIATGFLASAYPFGTNFYKDGLLNISVPTNATGLTREDNILIEFFKDSNSFVISIPVSQNA